MPMSTLSVPGGNDNQHHNSLNYLPTTDSPSEGSLSKATSLVFPPQTKHSPDYKDNQINY